MLNHFVLNYPNADALSLREEVFILEQGFSREDEYDSNESLNKHFYIYEGKTLVGYCRMDDEGHIGRVLVKKEYRKKGFGKMIIDDAISYAKYIGKKRVFLHAQDVAKDFYLAIGFRILGDSFMEAGALHWYMEKDI